MASESHGAPAYVVYKVGGDLGDYQFFNELPKEVSHPEILISECEPFSQKKLKISKRIHLF
jgi:hypothetical protein